jgi:outer membrane usher protein
LGSYYNQSIRYDVIDAPPGYDIGEGILRVSPAYRSGYAIEVGSAAFVSAVGRVVSKSGIPVPLASGRITLVRAPDAPALTNALEIERAKPQPFFTNSVGRFAAQNLEPGKRYVIELYTTPPVSFELQVPTDSTGLVDLKSISLPFELPAN